MKFMFFADPVTNELNMRLSIPEDELQKVRLSEIDKLRIERCDETSLIADSLLSLSILVRKLEDPFSTEGD